jgi:hypothetical protein
MPRKPKPVSGGGPERLAKAAEEARDAEDAWKLAVEQRNAIVVEAVDVHGMSQLAIADAIGRVDRIALQLVGAYWAGYRAGAAHVEPLEWHPAADGPRPADAGHLWRPGEAQQ